MDDNIRDYRDRLDRICRYSKQSENVKSCIIRFDFLAVGSIDDMSISSYCQKIFSKQDRLQLHLEKCENIIKNSIVFFKNDVQLQ